MGGERGGRERARARVRLVQASLRSRCMQVSSSSSSYDMQAQWCSRGIGDKQRGQEGQKQSFRSSSQIKPHFRVSFLKLYQDCVFGLHCHLHFESTLLPDLNCYLNGSGGESKD